MQNIFMWILNWFKLKTERENWCKLNAIHARLHNMRRCGVCVEWISIYLFKIRTNSESIFPCRHFCVRWRRYLHAYTIWLTRGYAIWVKVCSCYVTCHTKRYQLYAFVFIFIVQMQTKWSRETTTTIECMQLRFHVVSGLATYCTANL